MIGAAGNQGAQPIGADNRAAAGNRANAPGQQAKAAVIVAREAGMDLPANAQGVAASAIARGADPASVFAGMAATPQPSVEAGGDDDGAVDADVADQGGAVARDEAALEDGKAEDPFSPGKDKTFGPGAYLISEDPLEALLTGEGDVGRVDA